ncbi:MAG TPA: acetyl-CoA carboxylase biotin carboxyl carrier protein [Polyangia bacterium]|nr:acetyl-CoA carboxylase biotin carboxyl carrier protein [Polyangia bacterium]
MNGKKKGKALAVAAPPKTAKAKGASELELVRELAEIIGEYGLSEVEIDPSGRVRVRRELGGGAVVAAPVGSAPSPISLAPAPPVEAAAEAGTFVTSPFVGTFYRAPSPEAPAFVDVGAPVRKGQVVCIVEAMKLMNEIESEADGKIAEILVKNGEHVEYGQKLFRVA